MSNPVSDQQRVLAIFAHPDDIDFGAAGTVAKWVDEGWDVRYVVVTSGQHGMQDAHVDPTQFGNLREAEQRAAAAEVGVTDVTFLRYIDSELTPSLELRRDLSREFRRHRPHRLLAMDVQPLPTDEFINHPDHRIVGQTTLDLVVTGGTTGGIFPELVLDEGLEPWQGCAEIWLMGPAGGPTVVDITGTWPRKMAALRCHASQIGDWDVEAFLGPRLAALGAPHGYGYAEAFRVIRRRMVSQAAEADRQNKR